MINFAIVGCGYIAKKHIEAIRNLESCKLIAICDTNTERLKEFQSAYNVKGFTSLTDMLVELPDIDVINICTPSGIHASLAIEAAAAKKHIIVEKPIALTLEDADLIIESCRRNGVKLSVVHPNRFRPAVIELRKAMNDGLFGKLSHANATVRWNRNQEYYEQAPWRGTKAMDGGVLMNQAIHNLDLLLWLVGPIDEVQAYTATRIRDIEAEDVAIATVKFANGALGVIEAATTIFPKNYEESLSIFGEYGSAVIGGPTANWIKHWQFQSLNEEEVNQLAKYVENNPFGTPGHQHIIEDMAMAIMEDRSPIITGEDGRNALKLVLAVYKAAETTKKVHWNEM